MRLKPLSILVAAAALSACQKAGDPVSRGQAYFDAIGCAQCHQVGSRGRAWGPDLTAVGFRKSAAWLDVWLQSPHRWRQQTVMPDFNLKPEVRSDLVAYLSALKGQDWGDKRPWNFPEVKDDNLKRGATVFAKAGCVACHGQNGRGGYPNNNVVGGQIPSLSKVSETYTKEELMTKIRGGVISAPADPSQPKPLIFMPKWGDFLAEDEIGAVADYLISLGPSTKDKKSDW